MATISILHDVGLTAMDEELLHERFAVVRRFEDTYTEELAIQRCRDANVAILDPFQVQLSFEFYHACRELKLIIVNTTALHGFDTQLLQALGVRIANMKDYATRDVAELGVSLALFLSSNIDLARQSVLGPVAELGLHESVSDIWVNHPLAAHVTRSRWADLVVGIVGLGRIGSEAADIFSALGMRIIGYDRSCERFLMRQRVVRCSMEEVFSGSDILFVALSYDFSTQMRGMISAQLLRLTKPNAVLVSISHPDLVDLDYLIKNPTQLRGIALDYLVTDKVRQLMSVRGPNTIVTPHLGSQSFDAYRNMRRSLVEQALQYAFAKR